MVNLRVKKSACGCSLRTGCLIIGWFNIVLSIILLPAGIWGFLNIDPETSAIWIDSNLLTIVELISIIGVCIIDLIFGIILVVGVYKQETFLLKCWIFYMLFAALYFLVYQIFLGTVLIIKDQPQVAAFEIAQGFVGALIELYFVIIVHSYCWELNIQLSGIGGSSSRV